MFLPALIISAGVISGMLLVVFMLALAKEDNSLIDVFYGLVIALACHAVYFAVGSAGMVQIVLLLCVTLWALRLSIRLYVRHHGRDEDWRYAQWRETWSANGRVYFLLRSFLQIYVLQGVVMFIVALPVVLALAVGGAATAFSWVGMLGLMLWAGGFGYETIADIQLDRFARERKKGAGVMTEGLFRYSRRPNYFGEIMLWWGLWVLSLEILPLLPWGVLGLLAPLSITGIIVFVTGPMLERKWERSRVYRSYAKRTSYLIPLPPRESS